MCVYSIVGLVLLEPRATAGNGLLKCGQRGGWWTVDTFPQSSDEISTSVPNVETGAWPVMMMIMMIRE